MITLANLAAAWRARGGLRRWWLGASVAALMDRAFTFTYFIPTMVGLMATADSPESAEKAVQWANLNYVRHLIFLTAWLSALKAFALLYERRAANRFNQRAA